MTRDHLGALARATLAMTAVGLGVGMLTALPASAATLPSQAPLRNAAGEANGCTAEVTLTAGRPDRGDPVSVVVTPTLTCPASAGVRREVAYLSLYEIMPDGTRRVVFAPGLVWRASYDTTPLSGESSGSAYQACSGTHRWLARATLQTKRSATDSARHSAHVATRATLTC